MIGRPSNVKVFFNNKYVLQIDTLTNGRMKWVRVTIACSIYVLVWMLVALYWQHNIFGVFLYSVKSSSYVFCLYYMQNWNKALLTYLLSIYIYLLEHCLIWPHLHCKSTLFMMISRRVPWLKQKRITRSKLTWFLKENSCCPTSCPIVMVFLFRDMFHCFVYMDHIYFYYFL